VVSAMKNEPILSLPCLSGDLAKLSLAEQAALDRVVSNRERPTDPFCLDRTLIMHRAGLVPDTWQAEVLTATDPRMMMLCTRQAGKSTVAAALGLLTALVEAPALVLILSPTQRQSSELFKHKIMPLYYSLGRPVAAKYQTMTELSLANGSRIVSLPENEAGVRGFSEVSMLIVDEASRVSEDLYKAVRPMLAVSKGRLVALSTPFGQMGWFYEEWESKTGPGWRRFKVTAHQCSRIDHGFLEEERLKLGPRWFRQEYECSFEDVIDSLFSMEDIKRSMTNNHEAWF
jgi:hypothetical protein